MKITGFHAYEVYIYTKMVHFTKGKFDITKCIGKDLPRKKQLIKKWNDDRRKKDGMIFKEIQTLYPSTEELIRLYAAYWLNDPEFFNRNIIEDNFETYKRFKVDLINAERVFRLDVQEIFERCTEDRVKMSELIYPINNSIPTIFRMGLSPISLVILNELYAIDRSIEDIEVSFLEEKKLNRSKIILNKLKPIIYNYISSDKWREVIQDAAKKFK